MDVFFLGAGAAAEGDLPAALRSISKGHRALDWQLQSLERADISKINFMGGYHVQEVIEAYPQLNYTVIPDWQSSGIVNTLFHAPFNSKREALVLYSDTLFRPKTIERISQIDSDLVVGIDSLWLTRFDKRSEQDIAASEVLDLSDYDASLSSNEVEFTGLMKLSPEAIVALKHLNPKLLKDIPSLIRHLSDLDLSLTFYDVEGDWTEFNSDFDIARFVMGTKSETLYRLYPLVKKSKIGEQVSFVVKDWKKNPQPILDKIKHRFEGKPLVVRSSSFAEDCWDESHAGGFESVLNVDSGDCVAVTEAVNKVVASYDNSDTFENDQVLVQACLSNVKMSGVVFTRSLETGAPYYRLNFDDTTQSTESVTSGTGAHLRTIIVAKGDQADEAPFNSEIQSLLSGVAEVEDLLNYDRLDIEFAIDETSQLHIFQVRPIAVKHKNDDITDEEIHDVLSQCAKLFRSEQAPALNVLGDHAYFGVMPDWNPAEIIGVRPKPLAYSLYRHLIVDQVWAKQRAEFGYRDVSHMPLIRTFVGQPYVNIRSSLNSFIPASVSDEAAERICNAYLGILKDKPHLHDKIEFDVAFTVLTVDFDTEAESRLIPYGVTQKDIEELKAGLKIITEQALHRLEADISSIECLTQSRENIKNSSLDPLQQALLLLDQCQKHGTLAFAHAARAGFVAMTFLKGMVKSGVFSEQDKDLFLSSFNTVAGQFEIDSAAVRRKEMSKEAYIAAYGHLRPGTYDITAKAYWEDVEKYLFSKISESHKASHSAVSFVLSNEQKTKLGEMLSGMSLAVSAEDLISYCEKATQARESVKFEFSKNLSLALDSIAEYCKSIGIKRKKAAFLTVADLQNHQLGMIGRTNLKKLIKLNRNHYKLTQMVELPQLITSEQDFWAFERNASEPNFITSKVVETDSVCLSDHPESLSGKIVFIEQADPGYDWMFAHDLAGLITQYGGANSHMAIRSAELKLPAAIGVGEQLYESLKSSAVVRLDCGLKKIIRIK